MYRLRKHHNPLAIGGQKQNFKKHLWSSYEEQLLRFADYPTWIRNDLIHITHRVFQIQHRPSAYLYQTETIVKSIKCNHEA